MDYTFRRANDAEIGRIMEIIEQAKKQMDREGKHQWDDTYPIRTNIENDIKDGTAYVTIVNGQVVAYGAVVFTGEPAYDVIEGKWLTNQPFVVLHRLAVAEETKGHGVGLIFIKEVERLALAEGVKSFKVDTNHNNTRMLRLLEKTGFKYCGKIYYQHGERVAYEKLLGEK